MNGCTIPNTPIAVDFWKVRECPQARLFFLTHLHGDHIAGLTSSWHYPIYCSEITGRLLKHKYDLKDDFIKILEIGTASIVYLDRDNTEQMTVTALDANHCPGAVMFVFEGYFGRILHTGDFRFKPDMLEAPPLSHLSGKIDTLYLDNTYCSPRCIFPDRDQAAKEIIHIIQSHPNHEVVIGMRSLGKEDLLQEIALQCNTWISVPSSYYKTLTLIEAKNVFKNDCKECRVRVMPFHMISNRLVARLNEYAPTIVILPTALYAGIDAEPYCNQDNVFVVPYSDHSSYTELHMFVSFLRPCSITPIVKSKTRGPFGACLADRSDMSCFNKYLNKEGKTDIYIPASVKSFMANHRANPTILGKVVGGKGAIGKNKKMKTKVRERGIMYHSPNKESNIQTINLPHNNVDRRKTSELLKGNQSGISENTLSGNTTIAFDKDYYKADKPNNCRPTLNQCDMGTVSITGKEGQKEILNQGELKDCVNNQDTSISGVPNSSRVSDKGAAIGCKHNKPPLQTSDVHKPSSKYDKNGKFSEELDKPADIVLIESQGFVLETEENFSDNDFVSGAPCPLSGVQGLLSHVPGHFSNCSQGAMISKGLDASKPTDMLLVESQGFIEEMEDDCIDDDIVRVSEENLELAITSCENSARDIFAEDNSEIQTFQKTRSLNNQIELKDCENFSSKANGVLTDKEHMDCFSEKPCKIAEINLVSEHLDLHNNEHSMNIHDVHFDSQNTHHEYSMNEELTQDTRISSSNEAFIISDSLGDEKDTLRNNNDKNKVLVEMFGDSDNCLTPGSQSQTFENGDLEGFVSDLDETNDYTPVDKQLEDKDLDKTNEQNDICRREESMEEDISEVENLTNHGQDKLFRTVTDSLNSMKLAIADISDADVDRFDLRQFSVISVSARKKSSRRFRLYRNLLTGISRMSQV